MTHTDFSQLLSSIKALSPEQARELRQQLDRQSAQPKKPPGKTTRLATATPPKKKMTEAEFDQHLLKIGLLSQLPDADADSTIPTMFRWT